MMQPENPWSRINDRLEELERARKADRSTPIRNASIDGPVTISHRGAVTAPSASGGTTTVSPDGATTTAADGSATRLADGVAEVKAGPDAPWVPLEQVILDQVPDVPVPVQPASSPTPSVTGLLRQLLATVRGVENATPVVYEYHLSTTGAVAPSADTLCAETTATSVSLTALPGGGEELAYDVDYYVAVVAKSGDLAADPSPWVVGRLDPLGTSDIKVGAITAENLSSIITFSTLFRTAEVGKRGEWDIESLRFYNAAGDQDVRISGDDSFFSGDAHFTNLETDSAMLGGLTTGPPGGRFRVGASIIQAPALPLDHTSVALARVALSSPGYGGAVWDSTNGKVWTAGILSGSSEARFRHLAYNADGSLHYRPGGLASLAGTGVVPGDKIQGFGLTPAKVYFATASRVVSLTRDDIAAVLSSSSNPSAAIPAAPGAGGYAAGEPILGVQRTTGHILIAHRVQGAQTIGGQDYADNEVMVRRYTPGGTGSTLTLTLVQTIRVPAAVGGVLASVEMDNTSGSFDVPPVANSTALALGIRFPGGGFGVNALVAQAPNSGASVTATTPGGPLHAWYNDPAEDDTLGIMWDGAAFWSTEPTGALRKFSTSNVATNDVWHAYTYWNGTQETMLSPVLKSRVLGRFVSRWTIPPLPAGVTQVRLYESANATTRTRFERVGTFTGTPGQPLTIQQNPINPPAGSATSPPPATSDLVSSSASYRIYDDFGNEWTGAGAIVARDPIMPTDVTNKRYVDEKVPIGGSVTVPSGTGVTNVTVSLGVTLPDANYVVTATPNSTSLTQWATSGYTTTGFNVTVNRAAAGTYVVRWMLLPL